MKNSFLYLSVVAILSVVGWKYFKNSKPDITQQKYGSYLSCLGTPYDLRAKVQGYLILPKKALPESEEAKQALFRQAIVYQNLFTFTNIKDNNPQVPISSSNLSMENFNTEILNIEDATYPIFAEFEADYEIAGFPPEASRYLERLLPLGKIEKGEPAVKISYIFEANEYLCLNSKNASDVNAIKHIQPVDPYLAYFYVPKMQRRPISHPHRELTYHINPCLNPGYIDDGGVSPFGLWYYWRPFIEGHDKDKQSFDCNLFYREGVTVNTVPVTFTENTPKATVSLDLEKFDISDRPIKTSLFLGAYRNKNFQPFVVEDVERLIHLYTSSIELKEATDNLPYKKYDPALSSLLIVTWKIGKHLDIIKKEIEVKENYVKLILKGKLKLSKKDLELGIYLSPSSEKSPGYENFSRFAAENFLTSDIFIYEGHSADGTVFNGAFQELKNKTNSSKLKYQILGLFSCSSDLNYNAKAFPRVESPDFKRDIIQTASSYNDFEANVFIGLMGSLDSYLYNQRYVPFGNWAQAFKSDNMYILTNN